MLHAKFPFPIVLQKSHVNEATPGRPASTPVWYGGKETCGLAALKFVMVHFGAAESFTGTVCESE